MHLQDGKTLATCHPRPLAPYRRSPPPRHLHGFLRDLQQCVRPDDSLLGALLPGLRLRHVSDHPSPLFQVHPLACVSPPLSTCTQADRTKHLKCKTIAGSEKRGVGMQQNQRWLMTPAPRALARSPAARILEVPLVVHNRAVRLIGRRPRQVALSRALRENSAPLG